ncbi:MULTISPECIES: hypothetical protein [unclassified Enterococcus]|uniref:hypothetical protein n=1 Tax=unclassified Enterococcus TaxID=2608891 RepID=UPI0013ED46A0|nr:MULTISPECIES: hypothetical protein [unclassified Enterococcus]
MEEWQEVFEEWFPKELNKTYPIKVSKQYTSSQRWEIYEKLTKDQRVLVDRYRRYLINSRFMEENYLAATDWVFSDFKINPFFRTKRRQQKLYCDCGRELKVQYIVKSVKTGKTLKLGINHFAEHLHVSPAIASSIHQGMTKVDLALDELLWLKQQNIEFPERLWQEYCFALYQNRRLKNPYLPDEKLAKRVADFRKARMPIYLADHQALTQEIRHIDQQIQKQPKKSRAKRELFDDFSDELTKDVEAFLANYRTFLRKDWQSVSFDGKEHQSMAFFENFLSLLRKTKRQQTPEQQAKMETYANKQRFIQPAIYMYIWKQYCRYGFTEGFFDSIPRVMRNGFLKVLRREQRTEQPDEQRGKEEKKLITPEMWGQIAEDIRTKSVQQVVTRWEEKKYRFTNEQKQALEHYQKLEKVFHLDEETKTYLKGLL